MNVLIKELNEMDTKLLKLIFIKLPILYFSNKIMHGIYTYLIWSRNISKISINFVKMSACKYMYKKSHTCQYIEYYW